MFRPRCLLVFDTASMFRNAARQLWVIPGLLSRFTRFCSSVRRDRRRLVTWGLLQITSGIVPPANSGVRAERHAADNSNCLLQISRSSGWTPKGAVDDQRCARLFWSASVHGSFQIRCRSSLTNNRQRPTSKWERAALNFAASLLRCICPVG